jgi:CHASE2 domain-containing sensor protein
MMSLSAVRARPRITNRLGVQARRAQPRLSPPRPALSASDKQSESVRTSKVPRGKTKHAKTKRSKKRPSRRFDEWNEKIGRWPLWAQGMFWGVACALFVSLLGALGRTRGIEGGLMDSLFYMRKARYPDPQVAVVVVDEETVINMRLWPIPRRYFADLVDYLKRDGARTIAFDIAFSVPSSSPRDDALRAQACARAGNVVHASAFYTSRRRR